MAVLAEEEVTPAEEVVEVAEAEAVPVDKKNKVVDWPPYLFMRACAR